MPTLDRRSFTFFDDGSRRLAALCEAIGFDSSVTGQALELFRHLTSPWGNQEVGERPRFLSDITDDGTPYEFSLAIERHRPELRMLVEAQPPEPNVFAQWHAGGALSARLERDAGASLARLREVEDLFAIEDGSARFGIWHAVNMRAGAAPTFKVYLNPLAKGPARAAEIVGEALVRLGFSNALQAVPRTGLDEIKYFSLDLSASGEARVKVYLAHYNATCSDIESALGVASNYIAGEATEFCEAMAGYHGPYVNMPLQSCYAFTSRGGERPVAATLYFPVRGYVEDDEAARSRILAYMIPDDRALYEQVLKAFATRGLDLGTGLQTYASYRRQNFFRRVTVYLSPEAYAIGPRRSLSGPLSGPLSAPLSGPVSGPVSRVVSTPHMREGHAPEHILSHAASGRDC